MSKQKGKPDAPVVWLVNDDATQRNVLSGLLRKEGLKPVVYSGAEEALGTQADKAPALIVTDVYMPGMDGWRFCRLLRSPEYEVYNETPILVVSATFSGDDTKRITADLGANAFLPMPADGKRFVEQVWSLLENQLPPATLRVLLAEDDRKTATELKKAFVAQGYRVDVSHTARTASDAFAKVAYDVAVISYHLPDETGDNLLVEFREKRPDSVCLMLTTEPDPALALDWMEKGASAYLHKPFPPEYLVELCALARRERALLRAQNLLELRTRDLHESERRYRSLFSTMMDGVLYQDLEGRVTNANPAAERILGIPIEEMRGLTPKEFNWKLVHEDGTPFASKDCPANIALKTGKPVGTVVMGTCPRGKSEYRWLLANSVPEYMPGQADPQGVYTTLADFTERKRAEAERGKLEAQLQQAQKMESVGRLAGGVAHDFNNMLQVILGHAELALEQVDPSLTVFDDLKEIQQAAKRSADLTRQLLAFARRQTVSPRVLDLNATVEGILKMLRRLIGEDIHLVWSPGNRAGMVKIDPSQVDQILANLCVNARDAIAGAGKIIIETDRVILEDPVFSARIGVPPGAYMMLSLRDNGSGMTPETMEHIFEPFFTTKGLAEGTGLGLATVYGIVKQNNGAINVASEVGKGTVFKIYLPLYTGQEEPDSDRGIPEKSLFGTETILLVEDEPAVLSLGKSVLEHLGYTVLVASGPLEALRVASEYVGIIHLLITDVIMPDMNGRELAQELCTMRSDLRWLFMSGYTAENIARQGILEEGLHYLQKPFSKERLSVKVREVLTRP